MKPPPPPHNSINASGSIDDYAPWKQTPYHRTINNRPNCRNIPVWKPKYVKLLLPPLVTLWHALTATERAAWTPLAHRFALAQYHVFMRHNLDRRLRGLPATRTP